MKFGPIKSAALHITHNCNLRCRYCYSGEKSKKSMSLGTARASLDFIKKNGNGKCVITFFGGEPLLSFRLIREIVAENKNNDETLFRLSTNGTLLDKEKLAFLKANNVAFGLSIDGNQSQHDSNRKYRNESGSYLDVIKNLEGVYYKKKVTTQHPGVRRGIKYRFMVMKEVRSQESEVRRGARSGIIMTRVFLEILISFF